MHGAARPIRSNLGFGVQFMNTSTWGHWIQAAEPSATGRPALPNEPQPPLYSQGCGGSNWLENVQYFFRFAEIPIMNTPAEHILECNLDFAPNLLSQQTFFFFRWYALIFNQHGHIKLLNLFCNWWLHKGLTMGDDCAHSVNHLIPKYEWKKKNHISNSCHFDGVICYIKKKIVEGACTLLCMYVCHIKPQM